MPCWYRHESPFRKRNNMARVYGIQGSLTGKVANTIYAVVKGVNVARAYNPEPANPQTSAQIESRAKLKLLSQYSKQLAPIIGFRPQGLVSARNQFTKANYTSVGYNNDVASLELSDVDLTGGVVSLGQLFANVEAGQLTATVLNASAGVKSVVFGAVAITGQGAIHVFPVQIVTEDATTPGRFNMVAVDVAGYENLNVFAYGVRFNNDDEFAKYSQMLVSAAGSGSLNVIRRLDPSSTTLTETMHVSVEGA